MTNLEARRKALKQMIKQQPKPKKSKVRGTPITDEDSYQGGSAPRGTIA